MTARRPSVAHVADADIARAERCDECALRGDTQTDTVEHFIAHCDARRYEAFVRIVAAALHRAGHITSPTTAAHCTRTPHTHAHATRRVSDRCDGQVMEDRFRAANTRDQIAMCLSGAAQPLLRGTAARKSRAAHKEVARALVQCTQNLLLTRWHARCRALNATPQVAFAHADFGRQVTALQPNGSLALLLPCDVTCAPT